MKNANHRQLRPRLAVVVCMALVTTGLGMVLTAQQAAADVPSSPVYTQTATRSYADGGPVALTPVAASTLAVAPDGSVVFYDSAAHQIRQVDAADTTVSVLAGSGTVAAGDIDTSNPGASVDLPPVRQVWTDSAGDVFAWTCVGENCDDFSGVDELNAATELWSVRVVSPTTTVGATDLLDYEGYAVRSDGTVLAVDTQNDVVRSFAPGDQPQSGGTIVAGILQTAGSPPAGSSEPATGTAISPSGPIVAADDGSFDLAEGRHVDHVDAGGTLTRLPDAGPDAGSGLQWRVSSLAANGDTVFESLTDIYQGEVEAQPVDGGAANPVLAPSGTMLDSIGVLGTGSSAQLLAAAGEIEQWPLDGSSTAGAGQPYAGLATDAHGNFQSPNGTPLDEAFISDITALAGAPDGSIAIATDDAVRSLSGLSPDSTLSTIATGFTATDLHYANDGALYALVSDPTPHVIRIAADGTRRTVLGGGTQTPAAGVAGPDVLAYDLDFAVDPTNEQLYFTDGVDDTVWKVDPSTLDVEPLGQLPNAVQFAPASLVVDTDHDVLAHAPVGHDPRPLTRITTSGVETAGGCIGGPLNQLAMTSDGTLVGQNDDGSSEICGPDGTDHQLTRSTVVGPLTSDDRMLRPEDPRSGGLLGYTQPITAPTPSDTPSATVTADPGGVAVTVTPPAVSGEQITIDGFRTNGTATPVTAEFTTDGSGAPVTEHFEDLLRVWPERAGVQAPVWQFDVSAVEGNSATGDQLTDPPVQLVQQLDVDSTAPAAPGLSLVNLGSTVRLTVTPPGDADLDRVVLCQSTTGAVTDPHGCDEVAELGASPGSDTLSADIDPVATTSFTAFAVDDSGNVSTGTTVTRAAAKLVAGSSGVTAIGYGPAPSGEEVMWSNGGTAGARYALGTTAPSDPDAGLEPANFYSIGANGHGVLLPLAASTEATVSIFDWTDTTETAFHEVSVPVTQGATSDSFTVTTTSSVTVGSRPLVVAHATRLSPSGATTPLPGEYVTLYRRPVGTSTWLQVAGATTTAAGTATFTAPVPSGAVDYEVRHYLDTDPTVESTSPIVRTAVRQVVTASMASHVKDGGVLSATGVVSPRRGASIDLQRLVGHSWHTVVSARASLTGGNYRITFRPPTGRSEFRVVTPATSTLLEGVSAVHHVVVG